MSDDLLSFVQALDAADGEDALAQDLYDGSLGSGIGKRQKCKQPLKPIVSAPTTALSLDDLDGEGDSILAQSEMGKGKTGKRSSKKLDLPLPATLQRQVEQQVAYEETKRDLGKWQGVVREQREKETLSFPQRPVVLSAQPRSEILGFAPQTDFEKKYLELIGGNLSLGLPASSPNTTKNEDHSLDAAFPLQPGALERDVEAAEKRAKMRSDAFFKDRKAAHQAKIKSKKYRKMVARERAREAARNTTVDSLLLRGDDLKKRKKERELERARERLTLKTRKAAQWASDMLIHKHSNDPQSRQQVLEQVRAKDILRKELLGRASESDTASDGEDEEESIASNSDDDNEDMMRDITGDVSEHDEPVVGRVSFKKGHDDKRVSFGDNDTDQRFNNSDHDSDNIESDNDGEEKNNVSVKSGGNVPVPSRKDMLIAKMKAKMSKSDTDRKLLVSETTNQVEVSEEFAKMKEAEVTFEAPRQEDITLAGWGSWTGPNTTNNHHQGNAKKKPAVRVTKAIAGVDVNKRRDAKLNHVIITEKRPSNQHAMQVAKVPFPYTSREEYERAISVPLGLEWNTVRAHHKKTKPRVTVQAGAVIEPSRVKTRSSVVLQ